MIKAIYVLGHGRHGKDTVCEALAKAGYTFCSSSAFISEKVIYPVLKDEYGYKDFEDCFNRRHEEGMRKIWFDMICEYNNPDASRLSREIFKEYDIYAGLRNKLELDAVLNSEDFNTTIIWVDASERLPTEPITSFNIDRSIANYIVNNNGDLNQLENEIKKLIDYLNN